MILIIIIICFSLASKENLLSRNRTSQIKARNNNRFSITFCFNGERLQITNSYNNIAKFCCCFLWLVQMLNDMIIVVDSIDKKPERDSRRKENHQIHKVVDKKNNQIYPAYMGAVKHILK